MNKLELKEYNSERVVYLYTPEGRGKSGEIAYIFATKKGEILRRAEEDSDYYAYKALSKVEERVEKRVFPMEFIQAWY